MLVWTDASDAKQVVYMNSVNRVLYLVVVHTYLWHMFKYSCCTPSSRYCTCPPIALHTPIDLIFLYFIILLMYQFRVCLNSDSELSKPPEKKRSYVHRHRKNIHT